MLYVHLHQGSVDGTGPQGVARVEDLGPMLLSQLAPFVRHSRVVVKPVIDLHAEGAVSSYEFPDAIAERARLRSPREVFPHATRSSRRTDLDHPVPYDPHGPPDQTRDTNVAPLSRTHHRAKTHAGWQSHQVALDRHAWRSPHGLCRTTGPDGTTVTDLAQHLELIDPGWLHRALDLVEADLRDQRTA